MENDNLLNEWFFCIHLYWKDEYQEIDNLDLVHSEYRHFAKNNMTQTLYKCIGFDENYLIIQSKKFDLKIKKSAIKEILPKPIFEWGEKVQELERPQIRGIIEDLIWHQNKNDFLYNISVDGKRKSRQYRSDELRLEHE